MSAEPRRGCGFRKIGGLYLVGEPRGAECCKLPHVVETCPTCGGGIKQARGWTWIDAGALFAGACDFVAPPCPLQRPAELGRIGLLWVGARFYPTTGHFELEASTLGISKRIAAVPRGFELGRTWVALAHPRSHTGGVLRPAIFRVFRPRAIEKLVGDDTSAAELARLRSQGITPVIVPADDPDHRGTVYDDEGGDDA